MLPLLAQAIESAKPVSMDPVVSNWVMGAIGALILYEKLTKIFGKAAPDKREISGSIDTRPSKEPADKSEVEEELEDLEAAIQRLSEKLDTKVAEILTAGQARADAINREITAVRTEVNHRIQTVQDRVNDSIANDARHDEALGNLKTTQYTHTNQIHQLNQRLPRSKIP